MERLTVADAVRELEDLSSALDNAYWDASVAQHKDQFYNLISMLHGELNELAKLSVADHYMAYEPITTPWRSAHSKLKHLQNHIDDYVQRSKTATFLEEHLPRVIRLFAGPS